MLYYSDALHYVAIHQCYRKIAFMTTYNIHFSSVISSIELVYNFPIFFNCDFNVCIPCNTHKDNLLKLRSDIILYFLMQNSSL